MGCRNVGILESVSGIHGSYLELTPRLRQDLLRGKRRKGTYTEDEP